jgi:hypothetical protein
MLSRQREILRFQELKAPLEIHAHKVTGAKRDLPGVAYRPSFYERTKLKC